jgi:hypothetical protein
VTIVGASGDTLGLAQELSNALDILNQAGNLVTTQQSLSGSVSVPAAPSVPWVMQT